MSGRRRRAGDEAPDDLVAGQPEADPVAVAREIVLRQLTARARTRSELEQALAKRNVPGDAAAEVLDRFEELGLVNDTDFAEQWVDAGQRRQRGRAALRQELTRKGVERQVISEALDAVDDDQEYAAALSFARKKAAAMGGLEPAVRYRRLMGALARRGFGSAVAHRAYRATQDDPTEDEVPPDE